MKRYRKLISLVLTLLMVLALLPASLTAEGTGAAVAASGESALPEQFVTEVIPNIGGSEPVTGAVDAIDLSENNILTSAYYSGAPYGYYASDSYDSGGTPEKAAAYYIRWDGPVTETADKYPSPATAANVQYRSGLSPVTHVSDILMIPNDTYDSTANIARIKDFVYNYGAVSVGMEYDSSNYMNWTTHSFYMPATAIQASGFGHEVTVVGWDDNYSASNFKTNPGRNGAFIIKNSHGTGGQWGDGYFYLSYADKCVGRLYKVTQSESFSYTSTNTVFVAGDADVESYDHNYQYDPYGYTNSIGYTGSNPAYYYMTNVFTASSDQTLKAVMFSTKQYNVGYSVYIATGGIGSITLPTTSALPAASASGTQAYPGYHTVKLSSGVSLAAGQCFAVIVRIPGNLSYPVCIEGQTYEDSGKTNKTELNLSTGAQESYLSGGSGWTDLSTLPESVKGNLCIKAFTVDGLTGGILEQPLLGESTVSPGASNTAPGDSITIGGSDTVPGDSNIPGASGIVPGESEPTTGGNNSNTISSFLDSLNLPKNDDPPPTGGSSEDGFIQGVPLQRYNLYSSAGSELITGASLPAKYDLRTSSLGYVTSVKNQGGIGSCWTFAAIASLESTYLKNHNLNNGETTVRFYQSTPFLLNALGSSITLTANAPNPSAATFNWTVQSGTDSIIYTPSTTSAITLNYKAGGAETEVKVEGKVVYSSGDTFICNYRIPVTNYGTGDGSAAHPFEVSTPMGLQLIDCFAGTPSQGLNFKQTQSIFFIPPAIPIPFVWNPIGEFKSNKPFMGTYDGCGFTIGSLSLPTDATEPGRTIGLFGYTEGATIQNVIVDFVMASQTLAGDSSDSYRYGGIAAYANSTKIINCAVSGSFDLKIGTEGNNGIIAGGIAAHAINTTIDHCSYSGSIKTDCNKNYVGGLVGLAEHATVKTSFFNGNISGKAVNTADSSYLGGLIGQVSNSTVATTVNDCYATGSIIGTGGNEGGLAGSAMTKCSFANCYANVLFKDFTSGKKAAFSPLVSTAATLSGCYYNSTLAGTGLIANPATMKAVTAENMQKQASFAGFSFTPNTGSWVMAPGQNNNMPVLQNPLGTPTGFTVSADMPAKLYSAQTTPVIGQLTPSYVWPRPLNVVTVPQVRLAYNTASGMLKAGKYGLAEIMIQNGDTVLQSLHSFPIITRVGDTNWDGTREYNLAITALINVLTGKTTTVNDPYILNADFKRANGTSTLATDYDIVQDDLSLTDLLMLQQANAGVRTLDN